MHNISIAILAYALIIIGVTYLFYGKRPKRHKEAPKKWYRWRCGRLCIAAQPFWHCFNDTIEFGDKEHFWIRLIGNVYWLHSSIEIA